MAVRDDPVRREYVKSIGRDDLASAASLYLRAKRDANDRGLPPGLRQEARHTMHAVVERFPDAPRVAAEAADHELGIDNDADLKGVRDEHRAERGITAKGAAQARRRRGAHDTPQTPRGQRRGAPGARTAPQRPRPRTSRPTRRGGGLWRSRYVAQTGIPAAGRSATEFTLRLLGVMIGLSLAYLLLDRATKGGPGFRALEQGMDSVTGAVHSLIAHNVDPLAPRVAPSAAPGTPAGAIPGLGATPLARPAPRSPAARSATPRPPLAPTPRQFTPLQPPTLGHP